MPKVPEYQEQVRPGGTPSVRDNSSLPLLAPGPSRAPQTPPYRPVSGEGDLGIGAVYRGAQAQARAYEMMGAVIERAGRVFSARAIQQQEEVDGQEFARLRALADASWATRMQEESQNPDYEGTRGRMDSWWSESVRKTLEEAPVSDRVKGLFSQWAEVKRAQEEPVLMEHYLKRQEDRKNALFQENLGNLITSAPQEADIGRRRAEVGTLIESATWLSETTRQKMRAAADHDISWNLALADQRKAPETWTFDPTRYEGLDETEKERLLDAQQSTLSRMAAEADRRRRKVWEATSDEIAKAYLGGQEVSKGQLLAMAQKGLLDPDRAISWENAFENRRERIRNELERRANAAERAAAKAEREQDRAWRKRIFHAPPAQAELLELQWRYGTSPEKAKGAYDALYQGISTGKTTPDRVMDALGAGLIGEDQGRRLMGGLKAVESEQEKHYRKVVTLTRGTLQKGLKALGIDSYEALLSFEDAANPGVTPLEKLDDLGRLYMKRAIEESGQKTKRFRIPFTDLGVGSSRAGKALEEIRTKGVYDPTKPGKGTPSLDEIFGGTP